MKKTRKRLQASAGSKQKSLLPEPEFNPKWPRKNTHAHKALCLMLRGREITAFDFQDESSSQRLPVHIDTLSNKLGWPIKREDVPVLFKNAPKIRSVRKYYIENSYIKIVNKLCGGAI